MTINNIYFISFDQRQVVRVAVFLDILPVVGVEHHPGQLDAPVRGPGPGLRGAPECHVHILIGLANIPILARNDFIESDVVQTTVITLERILETWMNLKI